MLPHADALDGARTRGQDKLGIQSGRRIVDGVSKTTIKAGCTVMRDARSAHGGRALAANATRRGTDA